MFLCKFSDAPFPRTCWECPSRIWLGQQSRCPSSLPVVSSDWSRPWAWLEPISRLSLGFSCLSFLTTIWGEGIVFTWLLNITGISALLVWTSIGLISLRFRQAYKAQGLSLSNLPYRQPLYPVLPIGVIILGTLMFIAQGYAAVRQQPFEPRVSLNLLWYILLMIFFLCRTLWPHTSVSRCTSFFMAVIRYMRNLSWRKNITSYPPPRLTSPLMLYGAQGTVKWFVNKIYGNMKKRFCPTVDQG